MGIDAGIAANLLVNNQDRTLQSAGRLASIGAASRNQALSAAQSDRVAHDFEALFIGQMVEQMFGESVGTELFGDKETQEVYKGLLMEEYGKQITKSGGIGIASYVKSELLKLQEI